jgi:hypothetical protein
MRVLSCAALLFILAPWLIAQESPPATNTDSDQDGLSDVLEDTLLAQFQPYFMIHRGDCSQRPAEFVPFEPRPSVRADDGTIYGQAFPHSATLDEIELHHYHLWPKDCGETPHRLHAEHVSVLVKQIAVTSWKAVYWYAAAHEDTVCDASQIASAETLRAEERGAQVWVSAGKHASFLADTFCRRGLGCGGDRCRTMEPLHVARIINLGELRTPMNGAVWARSTEWPLSAKLGRSDFPESRMNLLEGRSAAEIVWANPEKRPMQAAILGANSAVLGAFTGASSTNTALAAASDNTDNALDRASQRTGNSLARSFHRFAKSIEVSAQKTGQALGTR